RLGPLRRLLIGHRLVEQGTSFHPTDFLSVRSKYAPGAAPRCTPARASGPLPSHSPGNPYGGLRRIRDVCKTAVSAIENHGPERQPEGKLLAPAGEYPEAAGRDRVDGAVR